MVEIVFNICVKVIDSGLLRENGKGVKLSPLFFSEGEEKPAAAAAAVEKVSHWPPSLGSSEASVASGL